MIRFVSDKYFDLGKPLLAALDLSPYSAKELRGLYRCKFPNVRTRFENVLAWLEAHGHIHYKSNLWHSNSRVNLVVLAEGFAFDYGIKLYELKSTASFGPHVRARAHFASYATQHGWSFEDVGRLLGKDAAFVKNAVERFRLSEVA